MNTVRFSDFYLIRQIGARLNDFLNKFEKNTAFDIQNSNLPSMLNTLESNNKGELQRVFNQYNFDYTLSENSLIISKGDMDKEIHSVCFSLIQPTFENRLQKLFKKTIRIKL